MTFQPTTTNPAAPTISQIKDRNAEAGYYFFSRKTMKFFGSKVLATVYSGPGGIYFVTSEDNHNQTAREFKVRHYNPESHDVRTAYTTGKRWETESFRDGAGARAAAKRLAREGEPEGNE